MERKIRGISHQMQRGAATYQNAITQNAKISKNKYTKNGLAVCSMPPLYKMISQSRKVTAISTRVVTTHAIVSDALSKPIILIS